MKDKKLKQRKMPKMLPEQPHSADLVESAEVHLKRTDLQKSKQKPERRPASFSQASDQHPEDLEFITSEETDIKPKPKKKKRVSDVTSPTQEDVAFEQPSTKEAGEEDIAELIIENFDIEVIEGKPRLKRKLNKKTELLPDTLLEDISNKVELTTTEEGNIVLKQRKPKGVESIDKIFPVDKVEVTPTSDGKLILRKKSKKLHSIPTEITAETEYIPPSDIEITEISYEGMKIVPKVLPHLEVVETAEGKMKMIPKKKVPKEEIPSTVSEFIENVELIITPEGKTKLRRRVPLPDSDSLASELQEFPEELEVEISAQGEIIPKKRKKKPKLQDEQPEQVGLHYTKKLTLSASQRVMRTLTNNNSTGTFGRCFY